ncbi:uncharacterized protein LOC118761334 [Octopus sinensis]|uniref:Uncharacterized protein LOC118761334 n=1 Tax=Octopus sinensis TaxID=2607531 RepID=A0A7E6EIB2_9MOLL|nr:uncharacterized protein LOC118761334 [Octopus sinensis]
MHPIPLIKALLQPKNSSIYNSQEAFLAIAFSEFSIYSLFNVCLHVYLRNWKDMKATSSESKNFPPNFHLYITLIVDDDEGEISFVAPSKKEHDLWTDGIRILMGKKYNQDLEAWTDIEIQVRLVEYSNITFPTKTPPIPEEPQNLPI